MIRVSRILNPEDRADGCPTLHSLLNELNNQVACILNSLKNQ